MSLEDAEKAIPAVVRMISGCEDSQTSADGESLGLAWFPRHKKRFARGCRSLPTMRWLGSAGPMHASTQTYFARIPTARDGVDCGPLEFFGCN